jgi:hypothetical protein
MTFRLGYFIATIALFIIEVLIALFVHDDIIRPYVGDILVVILIYCFVRAFAKVSVEVAAIATLLFAFLVEFLQYLQIVDELGLQHNKLARTVIGTSFAWEDIWMYLIGFGIVILAETVIWKRILR